MNQIKSKYILRICFSHLPSNTLLKLIQYNKNYQSKVDLTIEDYKIAADYYIKDNKIYRYETNELIFEGKYEKGEKIEGKEYKNNKIYFIGQYKKNLKYKGVLLNKKRNSIFEGEFNNGLFWNGILYHYDSYKYNIKITGKINNGCGTVEEYDYNCFLAFKGIYKDGKRFSGIEYNSHQQKIFEGVYHDNLRWTGNFYSPDEKKINKIIEGNGINIKEYDSNGELVFKGVFKNGKRFTGKGKEYYKQNGKLKFKGKFKDFMHYKGILYNINGDKEYEGLFNNGKKNEILLFKQDKNNMLNYSFFYGQIKKRKKFYGIEINQTGAFIGKFKSNGNYSEGKYYRGDFDIEEKKLSYIKGNLTSINIKEIQKKGKLIFEGKFKNGLFHEKLNGDHIYYDSYEEEEEEDDNIIYKIEFYDSGNIKYEGEFKNGLYYKGKEYYDNINEEPDDDEKPKLKFEGVYKDGKKYIGWEYNYQGGLIFVGEYNSDLFWNGCFYSPGDLLTQEKSGYINQGSGSNIKIYDAFGNSIFEGKIKNGTYYTGNGISKNIIYSVMKDISPDPVDKKIRLEINIEGTFKEGKLVHGCLINKYIINETFLYEMQLKGEFRDTLCLKGKYIIYNKRKIGSPRTIREEEEVYKNNKMLRIFM